MQVNSIAVFCGSNDGNNPLYQRHAHQLGRLLGASNITMIYGGGNKGLMGVVANGVLAEGGTVIGIIPQLLTSWERQHNGITELIVVEDMHVRKRMLYEKSDAVIILPGGFGTMDELFEVLTWNQLSIHNKPVFILNSGGFYDALLQHLHIMQQEGFLYINPENAVTVINTPDELFVRV
ncbi:MAG TPA: TIGR00730 family Rossman fold protein [Ferruginibacter sp.]|nr:TIGR00730 family Rossman fold protein [Ferruginibacter sp.]HMP20582.1 TIGR00730 family Rossman fold protein [Ferruginibacter sp.]